MFSIAHPTHQEFIRELAEEIDLTTHPNYTLEPDGSIAFPIVVWDLPIFYQALDMASSYRVPCICLISIGGKFVSGVINFMPMPK
jgi:hypothetical protein